MVKTYESKQNTSSKYTLYEQVDCLDERNQWLNAEVTETTEDKIKIHFTNFSKSFDIWLEEDSPRVQKQWRKGTPFSMNNRIDALDTYKQWKEARIIDMNETQIKIHYRGYTEKYDEWLHKNSERIQEIGSKSPANGIGKVDPTGSCRHSKQEIQPEVKKQILSSDREKRFEELLVESNLKIFPVEGDGNCLFRSFSHQLYGDTCFHDIIRASAMKYISIEREYYSQYIVGGLDKVDEYLEHQSRNGAWGDDIEIQALSEIYNKPVEIFAYSNTPMRTFHEDSGIGIPIKVAYHGQSHYNSIVNKDGHRRLIETTPGDYERSIIESAARGELREIITRARMDFDKTMQIDLEQALQASLEHLENEEAMIRQAIEESENTEYLMAIAASNELNSEEEMLKKAIEMSTKEMFPSSVQDVINSGFTLEQAMEAYHMVGDNPNAMIEYIFTNILGN